MRSYLVVIFEGAREEGDVEGSRGHGHLCFHTWHALGFKNIKDCFRVGVCSTYWNHLPFWDPCGGSKECKIFRVWCLGVLQLEAQIGQIL